MEKLNSILIALLFCSATHIQKGTTSELFLNSVIPVGDTSKGMDDMRNETPQQNKQLSLREDCELVTQFMANNGTYVLVYERAHRIRKTSAEILLKTTNIAVRNDAAYDAKEAQDDIDKVKPKMVLVHRNPEDWTIADLQKLKKDPKSAEIFKALVRVRDAIYADDTQPEIKSYLMRKLMNAMPEPMEALELRALMDRVQQVGGGKRANTPGAVQAKETGVLFDVNQNIKLNLLDNSGFDQQAALAMLEANGVKADKEHTLKAPLETLVIDAVKGIKQSVTLAA